MPGPYCLPRDTQGGPGLHHNLGTNSLPHYRSSTPTPWTDYLSSHDSQGRLPQPAHFPTTSDGCAVNDERSPEASYRTFRLSPPFLASQPPDENSRYECQHCGKTFQRPSTLRVNSWFLLSFRRMLLKAIHRFTSTATLERNVRDIHIRR
jgi:hypothetical protein